MVEVGDDSFLGTLRMSRRLTDLTIVIRGAGEMASGTACRLYRSGLRRILMTEAPAPLAVRRTVCFSEAVYEGAHLVEGIQGTRVSAPEEAESCWKKGEIPVLVDPENCARLTLKPDVVVDAILAKVNVGTRITDAPLVIGLGPGFTCGVDVRIVVETNRGHDLGRVILQGSASPNTGTPGDIAGETVRRVLRAPADGVFVSDALIGSQVLKGQQIGTVAGHPARSGLDGVLRGLIRPGVYVTRGLKIGDVDPRGRPSYCLAVSDKARSIGGGVLEAVLMTYLSPGSPSHPIDDSSMLLA
jgi:xanthine dehydrogenase accessory factor